MECVIQGYNLGQKLLRILHFLSVTECQSCRFGCAEAPLLTLGWSMLFSWGQKWSSRTSTLFFIFGGKGGGGGGGVFVTAYAFKSFILIRIRHGNFCSKLWLFNPLFLHVVNKGQHRKKFIAFFKFQMIVSCFLFLQRTRLYHQGLRFVQLLWIKTLWRNLRLKMRRFLRYKWVYFHLLVTFWL